jgi:hypothetical protein
MADAVERRLESGATDDEPLRSLLDLLAAHSRLEENDCYVWAESAVDEKASRALLQKIEAAELEDDPTKSTKNVKA